MDRRLLTCRLIAVAVAAVALEGVISALTPNRDGRDAVLDLVAPRQIPSAAHVLALVAALALLALAPGLWRGRTRAARLAVIVLLALAGLHLVKGLDYDESILDLTAAVLVLLSGPAFTFGARESAPLLIGLGAVAGWAAAYFIALLDPLRNHGPQAVARSISKVVDPSAHQGLWQAGHSQLALSVAWLVALGATAWFVRSLVSPARGMDGHDALEHVRAQEIVARHGTDSLAPFCLREDKAFHFAAGGLLAYRVLGTTAVISGDPVGPAGCEHDLMSSFLELARSHGWDVAVASASGRLLHEYRRVGLRATQIGIEAIVDPAAFSLEGRAVRKVRQSVHRVERLGWRIETATGGALDEPLMAALGAVDEASGQERRRAGFAMNMDRRWGAEEDVHDLYVLAWAPEGWLGGYLRFVTYRNGLSMDQMRRVQATPNGLMEALVVEALAVARERGLREVSLNFAGFGHLMGAQDRDLDRRQRLTRSLLSAVAWNFQMARLVNFNAKFFPTWRARHLVYSTGMSLPRAGLRVLQAESYVPSRRALLREPRWHPAPRPWGLQREPAGHA